jgi:cyclopropane fatty-acyl-phospholipid synthase-like methyltransferase
MSPAGAMSAVIGLSMLLVAAAGGAPNGTQSQPQTQPHAGEGPHDATVHHAFDDAESWSRMFDDPQRDAWQKPGEVAKALELQPGMVVGDLGAGTGYFTRSLSEAVSPGGMVLSIDIEPSMVQHLAERARKDHLSNVVPVLALASDPFLPQGRMDRVLIVDTYHHIDARLEYFARMRQAMSARGRVVIVDFQKRELPVGPPPEHKLEKSFIIDEMRQAGWKLTADKDFLPYQYFLVFEPASPSRP